MKDLPIHIVISPELYLKDPESTELGKRIVSKSIELIEELGVEAFTFKKLGAAIGSPESSIYRYFEGKHKLLLYLICWYWSWMEYKIVFGTVNQQSAEAKLKVAVGLLTSPIHPDHSFEHINEVLLHKIVIAESTKVFHTKLIDAENEKGYFAVYKRLIQRVSEMVLEYRPDYIYPNMLISTLIEGAHQQAYFVDHLSSVTDENCGENRVNEFYMDLLKRVLA